MARSKIGNVLNAVAAFIGVVDEDDAPMMSEKNNRGSEDDYDARGGYSSPRVREKNRTRQSSNAGSRSPRGNSRPAASKPASASGRTGGNRRSDTRKGDYYSDWNTAPRDENQYADNIYDSDTTDRNYNYDNGYDNEFDSRSNDSRSHEGNSRRNSRQNDSGSSQIIVLELKKLADCKSVIMSLLENKTVFISVEGLPEATVRRVEDTLSGAVCALEATFRRTSEVSYLLAPNSISVSGTRRTTERTY